MTETSPLHAFDRELCEHVRSQTVPIAQSNQRFRRLLDEQLVCRLDAHPGDGGLLTESELRLLEGAAGFARAREPWTADVRVYDQWIDGLGEIRRGLGESFAESWRVFSVETVDRLLRPGLVYADGVALVREWLTELRCHVRAIGPAVRVRQPVNGKPTHLAHDIGQITGIGAGEFRGEPPRPLDGLAAQLQRIADHFDPPPPDKVGTPYIAERLGCTTVWVTDMARNGQSRGAVLSRERGTESLGSSTEPALTSGWRPAEVLTRLERWKRTVDPAGDEPCPANRSSRRKRSLL